MARHASKDIGGTTWERRVKVCRQCGKQFADRRIRGRAPKYCSDACKQKAYREAKKIEAL